MSKWSHTNLSNGNVKIKVIAYSLLMLHFMEKALNDKNNDKVLIPCQGITMHILMNIFIMLLEKIYL